jgi:hypothetical protein
MTLALVLIFSAGLFFRGALNAGGLQLGFDPAGVSPDRRLDFSLANTPQPEGLRRMQAATDRVRSLPGVQAVGWSTLIPVRQTSPTACGSCRPTRRRQPRTGPDDPQQGVSAVSASITPDTWRASASQLLRGRSFSELESQKRDTPRVCLLDEGMAQRLFPDETPSGKRCA